MTNDEAINQVRDFMNDKSISRCWNKEDRKAWPIVEAMLTQKSLRANPNVTLGSSESADLLAFSRWAMKQFCGDSGTGSTYWETFPEFVKGREAIAKAEGQP